MIKILLRVNFSKNNFTCKMKVATVLESSLPDSMILKHKGMISVDRRKFITCCSSLLTSAPITPRLVNLKNSNGLVFEVFVVCRNG